MRVGCLLLLSMSVVGVRVPVVQTEAKVEQPASKDHRDNQGEANGALETHSA